MNPTHIAAFDEALVRRLRSMPALFGFRDGEIRDLLRTGQVLAYEAGDAIRPPQGGGRWVYCLISGKVKISREGNVAMLLQRSGDMFGESVLPVAVGGGDSATAVSETVCFVVDVSGIGGLADDRRHLLRYILYREFSETLAARLKAATDELARTREKLERLETAYAMVIHSVNLADLKESLEKLDSETDD